jgi:S-adenosylmethionine hydrolase
MADTDFGYVDGAPGKVKALSLATPQPTERQRIRDEIKAASIFARAYVNRNPRAIVTFSCQTKHIIDSSG